MPGRSFLVLLLTASIMNAFGADGFTVNVDMTGWIMQFEGNSNLSTFKGGHKLIRSEVKGSKVASSKVICQDPCAYPAINLAGSRIACYRKSGSTWHVAVMNADGSGQKNLVSTNGNGIAVLDWPAGDWIYYVKPGTGEFKKVNAATGANQAIFKCSYNSKTSRFSMGADAKHVGIRGYDGWPNDAFNCFPIPVKYPAKTDCRGKYKGDSYNAFNGDYRLTRCNIQICASGKHLLSYMSNHHIIANFHKWNWQKNEISYVGDGVHRNTHRALIGESDKLKGQYVRTSCNSDKWYMEMCGPKDGSLAVTFVTDWVGKKETFCIGKHVSTGDFWVKPPSGSEGKIQTINGNWVNIGDIPTDAARTHTPARRFAQSLKPGIRYQKGCAMPVVHLGNNRLKVDIRGRQLFALDRNADHSR